MNLFASEIETVDRSTLEHYATCPAQARYIADGRCKVVGAAAVIGAEGHDAISKTITEYIETRGFLEMPMSRLDSFRETLLRHLRESRPDVQPQVLASLQSSAWGLSRYVSELHYENIVRFDGGTGDLSGQLAFDVEDLGLRITSEVDLLHATPAPELLTELDWKSGWKNWTERDVRDSFQFQMHAFLVLSTYETVEALRVSIWNTRAGRKTYAVEFRRDDLKAIETRIRSAAAKYLEWRDKPAVLAETWPTLEKCRICSAAAVCPAADHETTEIATDPAAFVDQLVVVGAKYDAMKRTASAYVDRHGDIISTSGAAFGTQKPKSARKPTKDLYEVKTNGDGDEAGDDGGNGDK